MGAEQNGRWQRILLFLAAGVISVMITTSCRTISDPPVDGSAAWQDQMESQLLDGAEAHLQKRDYAATLDLVDRAVSCCRSRYPQRALQILERTLAAQDNPIGSDSMTIHCLKGLKKPFSGPVTEDSARCRAAALNEILTDDAEVRKLKRTVQKLEKQIEQLKAVDLEPALPNSDGNTP